MSCRLTGLRYWHVTEYPWYHTLCLCRFSRVWLARLTAGDGFMGWNIAYSLHTAVISVVHIDTPHTCYRYMLACVVYCAAVSCLRNMYARKTDQIHPARPASVHTIKTSVPGTKYVFVYGQIPVRLPCSRSTWYLVRNMIVQPIDATIWRAVDVPPWAGIS